MAPGLMEESDTPKIAELSRTLFRNADAAGHLVTDLATLGAVMHAALPADVVTAPEIGFVHRKLGFAEVYFVVNTSNRPVHSSAAFRVQGLTGECWDPITGAVSNFSGDLDLAPYESRVLFFSKGPARVRPAATDPMPAPVELNGKWTIAFAGESPAPTTPHSWTDDDAHKYFSGQATYETTVTAPRALAASKHAVYLSFGEGTPVATA